MSSLQKLKKAFIFLVLLGLALLGIYAIQKLKGSPQENPINIAGESSEDQNKGLLEVLNIERPNDISLGKITNTNPIVIGRVKIESPGFVVIFQDQDTSIKNVVGHSGLLAKGETKNVYVYIRRPLQAGEKIFIGLRFDDGDSFFDFSGKYDKDLSRADGKSILWEVVVER